MLNPGLLVRVIDAGVALSQAGPTGTGMPATDRLVICKVIFDVVVTAPVFRSTVPFVGPFWRKAAVAVTGIRPNSWLNADSSFGKSEAATGWCRAGPAVRWLPSGR